MKSPRRPIPWRVAVDCMDKIMFSTEALLRGNAPTNIVLESFVSECTQRSVDWSSPEEGQRAFAGLVQTAVIGGSRPSSDGVGRHHYPRAFPPPGMYLRSLLKRYTSMLEQKGGVEVEDNDLADAMASYAFGSANRRGSAAPVGPAAGDGAPNPNDSGYSSYRLPDGGLVGIRVHPHHNDLGVRKVWEAGAALAEYLLAHPEHVDDRIVVELGAGVGLTGIVVSGMCHPRRVHMTDLTQDCLSNMEHNIEVNGDWLAERGVNNDNFDDDAEEEGQRCCTCGYLDWEQFADEGTPVDLSLKYGAVRISDADVLLAADVVYDWKAIPDLVRTTRRLLLQPNAVATSARKAIFATTYRNKETFDFFECELQKGGISCDYVPKEEMDSLDRIFPCYFIQAREEVRICTMSIAATSPC